jgi:hypothetical protein
MPCHPPTELEFHREIEPLWPSTGLQSRVGWPAVAAPGFTVKSTCRNAMPVLRWMNRL